MKTLSLVLSMLFVLAGMVNAKTINQEKSAVHFEIGNMKVRTVSGSFGGMMGDISFDENDLENSFFNVSINASSVNTENTKRDDHLRNEDFFYTDMFPKITFTSSRIDKTSKGFVTKGIMDMHGIKREVEIPFVFENNTFRGKIVVNRLDYKVGDKMKTGMVSAEAHVEIICVID